MNAFRIAAVDWQIPALGRTAAEDDRVKLVPQPLGGPLAVLADEDAGLELDAFLRQQVHPALDDEFLVQLHVRNAIHQQSADAVLALENGDTVTSLVELIRAGQSRRAGADDGDLLPRADGGDAGDDPAFLPAAVDDGTLVVLDRDGGLDDA